MAQIVINIPDEATPDVVAAFVQEYRWRSAAEDGPQAAWPKKCLVTLIKNVTRKYRLEVAAEAARQAAAATADLDAT